MAKGAWDLLELDCPLGFAGECRDSGPETLRRALGAGTVASKECPLNSTRPRKGFSAFGHEPLVRRSAVPLTGLRAFCRRKCGFRASTALPGAPSSEAGENVTPDIGRSNPSRGSASLRPSLVHCLARLTPPFSLTPHTRGARKGRSEPLKDMQCPLEHHHTLTTQNTGRTPTQP